MSDQSAAFGPLLRQQRVAAGLTQQELAERADLSRRGIADLERGRRRPLPATARRLADALALEGAARAELLNGTRWRAVGRATRGPSASRLRIPLSTFVGRQLELSDIRSQLQRARLLTLTGSGGIGKTRLALEIGRAIQAEGKQQVCLVELAATGESSAVARTTVAALGLAEPVGSSAIEALTASFRHEQVLLILDNCEQVLQGCAELAEAVLSACADVQILATSRERLGVTGEIVWRVPPMPLPSGKPSVDELERYDSTRLFLERARALTPEFAPSAQDATALATVCARLDGIPLAIELAAARITVLSVQQIADRLDDALGLLSKLTRSTPAGKQTLRATIDWSYNLLSEPEQRLFERLSVFRGGWRLDAAEAICADAAIQRTEILDALDGLVTRSLVLREPEIDRAYRFRLLETIRQYALERLVRRVEDEIFRGRHADFFAALAERMQTELLGHDVGVALDRLDQEHDNLRASLQWLLDRSEAQDALRLAGTLGRFWQMRCHFAEGQIWTERALALSSAEQRVPERAMCLYSLGNFTGRRGDTTAADAAYQEALAIWRELSNAAEEAWTLWALGQNAWRRGDYATAKEWLEQGVVVSRAAELVPAETNALFRLGDVALDLDDHAEAERRAEETFARASAAGWAPATVMARRILGEVHLARGDTAAAVQQFEASLADARALGNQLITAQVLLCLAQQALEGEDLVGARQQLAEALELARTVQDEATMAKGLEDFGALAVAAGHTTSGMELVGAAEAVRRAARAHRSPREQRWLERYLARARAVLGARGAERALRTGALLSEARAVERALELRVGAGRDTPDNLTPREHQVATLVAQGLSNPQIARELVIGERTVQTHVGNMLAKLGLDSRVQIAAWVTEQRLAGTRASAKTP